MWAEHRAVWSFTLSRTRWRSAHGAHGREAKGTPSISSGSWAGRMGGEQGAGFGNEGGVAQAYHKRVGFKGLPGGVLSRFDPQERRLN